MAQNFDLFSLFLISFLSATILPGSSEILFSIFILEKEYNFFFIVLVATFGNSLGGITTFFLGKYAKKIKYIKIKEILVQKGVYLLVFSWVPFIGDMLCFVAGWLGLNLIKSTLYIFIGKFFRYILIYIILTFFH